MSSTSSPAAQPAMGRAEGLKLIGIAVLLFGGAWPITKNALAHATPLWFATGRSALSAITIALLLAYLGRLRWPNRQDWSCIIALGVLQLAGYFALVHEAVQVLPAGRTAILANVIIFWLIPLSVLFLREKVSALRWVAAGLGLVGVITLIGPWSLDWHHAAVLRGYAELLSAGLLWSIAIIISRARPPSMPMLELLPYAFGISAVLLAALAAYHEPHGGIGMGAWIQLAFIGLIAAPIGTWAVIEAGRRLPASVSSVGFLLVPAAGLIISALWQGEAIGWDVIAGGILIVASVALATRG